MALTLKPDPFAMYELKLRAADYIHMEEMQTLNTKFYNDYTPSAATPP